MKIGVLDIHGSVKEHVAALEKVGGVLTGGGGAFEIVLVKEPKQIEELSGLIIPGGESTTMDKLMSAFGLREAIVSGAKSGKLALWGTCAGAILLARELKNAAGVKPLGLMDIVVQRNAYGRQLDSFETQLPFNFANESINGTESAHEILHKKIPAVFIRAPKILAVGEGCEILARHGEGIVAVKQGRFLATTFHPELTDDTRVHEWFVGWLRA